MILLSEQRIVEKSVSLLNSKLVSSFLEQLRYFKFGKLLMSNSAKLFPAQLKYSKLVKLSTVIMPS